MASKRNTEQVEVPIESVENVKISLDKLGRCMECGEGAEISLERLSCQ